MTAALLAQGGWKPVTRLDRALLALSLGTNQEAPDAVGFVQAIVPFYALWARPPADYPILDSGGYRLVVTSFIVMDGIQN